MNAQEPQAPQFPQAPQTSVTEAPASFSDGAQSVHNETHDGNQKDGRSRKSTVLISCLSVLAIVLCAAGICGGYFWGRSVGLDTNTEASGFDNRTPGRDAEGNEVPFVDLGTVYLPDWVRKKGFNTQCDFGGDPENVTRLWVLGDFTNCKWAREVFTAFKNYEHIDNPGYRIALKLDDTDVYCHYHDSLAPEANGIGLPAWECRANGGKQFVVYGAFGGAFLGGPCWTSDGKLKGTSNGWWGGPTSPDEIKTKPKHLKSRISDCK